MVDLSSPALLSPRIPICLPKPVEHDPDDKEKEDDTNEQFFLEMGHSKMPKYGLTEAK